MTRVSHANGIRLSSHAVAAQAQNRRNQIDRRSEAPPKPETSRARTQKSIRAFAKGRRRQGVRTNRHRSIACAVEAIGPDNAEFRNVPPNTVNQKLRAFKRGNAVSRAPSSAV